jgi:enoyl-CoA hydratase
MCKQDALVKKLEKVFIVMSSLITYEEENNIGIITINREDKLNALSSEVLDELRNTLEGLLDKRQLVGLILTGAGDKAFIAGADIAGMNEMDKDEAHLFALKGQQVSLMLEECRFPIIACVNGYALGGGLEMALACDFIYATDNAVFGLPEVSLGLIPGFGGTQRLAKVIGRSRAKELVFTGKKIKIGDAKNYGLVLESFENKDALIEGAKNTLTQISNNSPLSVGVAKNAMNLGVDLPNLDGLEIEAKAFSELFESYDMKEGTQAFMDKRKANFKGE